MQETIVLCILLFTHPLVEARRGGGGGGFSGSRGGSAARSNVGNVGGGSSMGGGGGFQPNRGGFQNQGGINQRPGGNYHPQNQPNYGGGFHGPAGGGFQNQGFNNRPSFTSGNSFGSPSRAGTFKHALAGAALGTVGGLLAFEAGKAIIQSATTPFHHGSRDYYFDQQNYRGNANGPRCSMPLSQLIAVNTPATTVAPTSEVTTLAPGVTTTPSPNQVLQNLQFADGTRPKEVVWGCQANEVCCGSECCPAPQQQNSQYNPNSSRGLGVGSIVLIVLLGILLTSCLCCFCAYQFCRSTIQRFLPSRNNDATYYDDSQNYPGQGNPAQSYPMNPMNYPQNSYPQQPQYGQYPPNPQYGGQQYPSYPPQQNYPGPKY
ncbi:CX domain-containing protein [Aphelenchoides besseyi]|nr:CX domain-containing protein [Aphelenchoides besseyi]